MFKRAIAEFGAILLLAGEVGHSQEVRRPKSEGITTTLSVTNERLLPYEPLAVLLSLQNEPNQPKRVLDVAWLFQINIAQGKNEKWEWRVYIGHNDVGVCPSPPNRENFAPGEIKNRYGYIDHEAPFGQHVFARPGSYRLRGYASYDGRFISNDLDVVVREPEGLDAKAYRFLRKSKVHRFFSEGSVEKYPRTRRNMLALEQFIIAFDGSEYSNHARLGLAFMWMKGINGKIDLQRARKLLTQVTKKARDPLASRAHYYLGTLWRQRKDDARALAAFRAVLSGKPDPYFASLAREEIPATK